jgi:iron(III) transport system substrate-binding protein
MVNLSSIAGFAASFALCAAFAQSPAKNDEIFRYRGRRPRRAPRREGEAGRRGRPLHVARATESKPLAEAFEKKYGVKVELWRALSDKVVQRTITEAQGRRHAVDVVETNGPEMEMLAREKLLAEFHSPYLADLPASRSPRTACGFPTA